MSGQPHVLHNYTLPTTAGGIDPVSTARVPTRHYHVLGGIGVGKSRLVKNFGDHGFVAIPEDIPPILFDYLSDRRKFAWIFQETMLEKAVTRSCIANIVLRHAIAGIVVERPWYENQAFALANAIDGSINEYEYATYTKWFSDARKKCKVAVDLPPPTTLFLWAPEDIVIRRMVERGRLNEDEYDDMYLERLSGCYFIAVLQSYLCDTGAPKISVVDWTTFGDCNSECIQRARPGEIRYVTQGEHGKNFLFATTNDGTQCFNLDWYMTESHPKRDQKFRMVFRDSVMKSLSKHLPVALVASDETRALVSTYYVSGMCNDIPQ